MQIKKRNTYLLQRIEEYITTLQKVENIFNDILADEMNKYRLESGNYFVRTL